MNEIMTHGCFSENYLLIPRQPPQLAASENPKSAQNSRHTGRVTHDSNKIARNRLDTSQIVKLNPTERGTLFLLALQFVSTWSKTSVPLSAGVHFDWCPVYFELFCYCRERHGLYGGYFELILDFQKRPVAAVDEV